MGTSIYYGICGGLRTDTVFPSDTCGSLRACHRFRFRRKRPGQLLHRSVKHGMSVPGSDFPQGLQHELTVFQIYMRNRQIITLIYQLIVKQNIQIQGSGAPVHLPRPARRILDPVQRL